MPIWLCGRSAIISACRRSGTATYSGCGESKLPTSSEESGRLRRLWSCKPHAALRAPVSPVLLPVQSGVLSTRQRECDHRTRNDELDRNAFGLFRVRPTVRPRGAKECGEEGGGRRGSHAFSPLGERRDSADQKMRARTFGEKPGKKTTEIRLIQGDARAMTRRRC